MNIQQRAPRCSCTSRQQKQTPIATGPDTLATRNAPRPERSTKTNGEMTKVTHSCTKRRYFTHVTDALCRTTAALLTRGFSLNKKLHTKRSTAWTCFYYLRKHRPHPRRVKARLGVSGGCFHEEEEERSSVSVWAADSGQMAGERSAQSAAGWGGDRPLLSLSLLR